MLESFFDESKEQSQVKARIVEKYFDTWASIITAVQDRSGRSRDPRIAYVDLFCGPGRYKDGAQSTPLKIIEKAINNPTYKQRLVTIFNDKDDKNIQDLQTEISKIPGIDGLKYQPEIWNQEVGDKIAEQFEKIKTVPVLAFIDPWGYAGLSLRLVNAFLKNWGCDCIFFFNYSRINAGLSNPFVREHMEALFGKEKTEQLSAELDGKNPREREAIVVNGLATALKSYGHRYVLPFCFKKEGGVRTSHHLILVSKSFKAYDVMKEIMAKESVNTDQGVPNFQFYPDANEEQMLLFELSRPLDDLEGMLLRDFKGKTIKMNDLYEAHSVDRPYLKKNYKELLAKLEAEGKIQVLNRKSKKGFSDENIVKFP